MKLRRTQEVAHTINSNVKISSLPFYSWLFSVLMRKHCTTDCFLDQLYACCIHCEFFVSNYIILRTGTQWAYRSKCNAIISTSGIYQFNWNLCFSSNLATHFSDPYQNERCALDHPSTLRSEAHFSKLNFGKPSWRWASSSLRRWTMIKTLWRLRNGRIEPKLSTSNLRNHVQNFGPAH